MFLDYAQIFEVEFSVKHIDLRSSCQSRNRCIRSKISEYPLDLWTGWIRCRCDAHKKQVDVKELYNQVPQTVGSRSSRQAEFSSSCSHSSSSSRSWGQDAVVRASARQRAWALRTPVEPLSRMRKKCCYNIAEVVVNMLQSVLVCNSPLTHNQHQPFRNTFENKVWNV